MNSLTIHLPQTLYETVLQLARQQELSPDRFVSELLQQTLLAYSSLEATTVNVDNRLSLEDVVAQIQALPPNPTTIHPATESLLDYLVSLPDDPEFEADEWDRDWAKFEAQLKVIDRADDIAEGRL